MRRHLPSLHCPGSSADGSSDEPHARPLSKDVIFDLLRVERRRLALRELRRHGPASTLSTLARRIAAEENGIDVGAVTSVQRKRVYIALYQAHLPKLDDADVVSFDSREGAVELADNASLLYPYLDLETAEVPRSARRPQLLTLVRQARRQLSLGGGVSTSEGDAPSG